MLVRSVLKSVGSRIQTCLNAVALTAVAYAVPAIAIESPAVAEDFYQHKTITILVGYTPGGGYDLNARLLAKHIGRFIPGNPTIVVANMPGAAGLVAVQYLNGVAPKDGTYLLHFNFGSITDARLGMSPVKLDFTQFAWIGSISQDLAVCLVWGDVGVKSIADAKARKELNFGLTAAGSSSNVNTKILKNIFQVPVHQVAGYPGSADQRIAVERGELDGQCNPWSSTPADWIKGHKFYAMMKFTPAEAPDLPKDVPYAADIAPTPHDAEVIKMLTAAGQVGRPFVAADGVPEDRMAILRKAFDQTMADSLFKEDAAKGRMDVSPKTAAQSLAIVKAINDAPESIAAEAKKVLEN
jgi:tripartite-type tricarboxylate transporter receptor subunit TctC